MKRSWHEDTVFKHQSRSEPPLKKRFINDTVRSDFHRRFLARASLARPPAPPAAPSSDSALLRSRRLHEVDSQVTAIITYHTTTVT